MTPGSPPPSPPTPNSTTTAAPAPTISGPTPTAGFRSPSRRSPTPSGELPESPGASPPPHAAPSSSSRWTTTWATTIRSPAYGGKAIPDAYRIAGAIWPAAASRVESIRLSDTPQQIDLNVLVPGTPAILNQTGRSTPNTPLAATFTVAHEGRHLLQAKLSTPGAPATRLYIKVDYLGPASSTLF